MRKVIPKLEDPADALIRKMNEAAPGFSLFVEAFRRFEIAVRMVDATNVPHSSAVIDALRCPGFLMQCHRVMYESHARELVARVTSGEAIRRDGELDYVVLALGTKSEVMSHILRATLASRLVSDVEGLYEKLFLEVFGVAMFRRVLGKSEPRAASHSGAYDELLTELRRVCRSERDRPAEPMPEELKQKAMDEAFGALDAEAAE